MFRNKRNKNLKTNTMSKDCFYTLAKYLKVYRTYNDVKIECII